MGSRQCIECGDKTYQPEKKQGECLYCKTARGIAATDCRDAAVAFSKEALLAFVVVGAVGIAFCFRSLCLRFNALYLLEKYGLLSPAPEGLGGSSGGSLVDRGTTGEPLLRDGGSSATHTDMFFKTDGQGGLLANQQQHAAGGSGYGHEGGYSQAPESHRV